MPTRHTRPILRLDRRVACPDLVALGTRRGAAACQRFAALRAQAPMQNDVATHGLWPLAPKPFNLKSAVEVALVFYILRRNADEFPFHDLASLFLPPLRPLDVGDGAAGILLRHAELASIRIRLEHPPLHVAALVEHTINPRPLRTQEYGKDQVVTQSPA